MPIAAPQHGQNEKMRLAWRRPLAAAFGFGLIALAVMTGALGITIGVALTALLALPHWRDLRRLFPLDLSHSALLIFIAWAWTSVIWSPHERTNQALYMTLGALVYPLFVFAIYTLPPQAKKIAAWAAMISGMLMLMPYLLEGSFGLISGFIFDQSKQEAMLRDATRGISAIVMAMPALAALWLYLCKGIRGQIAAAIMLALVLLVCIQFQLIAGVLALTLGGVFFAIGYFWPRPAIVSLTLAFLAMILLAPMIMPIMAGLLEEAPLPFSWEWRLKMWIFTGEQINAHPFLGWGLEAARSFTNDVFELRGFTLKYLSAHPHNFGLHVWLETGLVGALLLAIAIGLFGLRLAGIRNITALQGAAISASAAVFLVFCSISFGAWQEWLWASMAWIAALCTLLRPTRANP